jgi:hypothetical protein
VTYNVATSDFTVNATPTTLRVRVLATGNSTITLASLNGFAGPVSLAAFGSSGIQASLSPTGVTLTSGGTASSTLKVSSETAGNYTVTVTGTSGSIVRSVSVLVIVSDFSMTATLSSLSLRQGSTGYSTITLTSLNGFTGTVSLSVAVSPSGSSAPKCSLNTTSITLTSGGSGSSTLKMTTTKKTVLGSYTVTVTGTSGSVSHSVTLTLTVTA